MGGVGRGPGSPQGSLTIRLPHTGLPQVQDYFSVPPGSLLKVRPREMRRFSAKGRLISIAALSLFNTGRPCPGEL